LGLDCNGVAIQPKVPYSPELNPIEHVFTDIKKYLKDTIVDNKTIIKKIKKSFTIVKKNNLKSYFEKSLNYYLNM
jgi:transposase